MKSIILVLGLILIAKAITVHDSTEDLTLIYEEGGETTNWQSNGTMVYVYVDLTYLNIPFKPFYVQTSVFCDYGC